jgi:hypothetical protein
LQLPKLAPEPGEYQFEWPLRQISLAEQMGSMLVPSNPGADWQTMIEERDRRVMEDNKRLQEYYSPAVRAARKILWG